MENVLTKTVADILSTSLNMYNFPHLYLISTAPLLSFSSDNGGFVRRSQFAFLKI